MTKEIIDLQELDAPVSAMQVLSDRLRAEPDYAYSFHANIAVTAMDTLTRKYPALVHGQAHRLGNEISSNVMCHLFGRDIDKSYADMIPEFESIEDLAEDAGEKLFQDFVAISASHGVDIDSMQTWTDMPTNHKLVWARLALTLR